jgi:hypothetical protein
MDEVEYWLSYPMEEADANIDATTLHMKTSQNQSYEQAYSIHELFDDARA